VGIRTVGVHYSHIGFPFCEEVEGELQPSGHLPGDRTQKPIAGRFVAAGYGNVFANLAFQHPTFTPIDPYGPDESHTGLIFQMLGQVGHGNRVAVERAANRNRAPARVHDQGAIAQGGNGGTYRAVAGGEALYGFVVDFLALRNIQDGATVGFVFPEEGVSAVTEPVAILDTAENVEAAQAFVDFLLSVQGQELAASQGYLPAHPDVAAPDYFPDRSEIQVINFDPAEALANDQPYKERFADMFGG